MNIILVLKCISHRYSQDILLTKKINESGYLKKNLKIRNEKNII